MIELPNFERAFDHENAFYLSCDPTRIGKLLAHYELYRRCSGLSGAIVECGVFKGASFVRFAMFRELLESAAARKLIGFDAFGVFPETQHGPDQAMRRRFIDSSGTEGIGRDQLMEVLRRKRADVGVELIAGDVTATVPRYVADNPQLRIALLNLDVDVYEPSVTVLEHLYPRVVTGGVVMLDDYGVFPGETKAVDDYFRTEKQEIRRFPFAMTPSYVIKDR
jgi:hypothetical protein